MAVTDVSIIIPLYNAERYVALTLDSICCQTKSDGVEVILIDDGSTDRSYSIVSQYIRRYGGNIRFRLLKNDGNVGPGVTRNRGVDCASGKYLMFVDADDILHPTAVERMFCVAEEHGAEVVCCGYRCVDGCGNAIGESKSWSNEQLTAKFYHSESGLLTVAKFVFGVPWCKLLLRSFMVDNGILFSPAYREEDFCWWSECGCLLKRLYFLDEYCYFYRVADGSLTHKCNEDRYMLEQRIVNFRHLYDFLCVKGLLEQKEIHIDLQMLSTFLIKFCLSSRQFNIKEKYERYKNFRHWPSRSVKERMFACVSFKDYINNLHFLLPDVCGFLLMLFISQIRQKKRAKPFICEL